MQVPQQYHNLDSVQHRVNWATRRLYGEQDVFFNLVMPGKDHYNAAFFCGTGAVLRRTALAPHGGIDHGHDHRGPAHVDRPAQRGLEVGLPERGARHRPRADGLQVASTSSACAGPRATSRRWRYINPLTCAGLTRGQRINYVASLYHWTIGVPKLIFYLAPPWMLFTGQFPIVNFDAQFLAVYLAFLATLLGSLQGDQLAAPAGS